MLLTFKSKAAADVLMYEEHARPILELLHKEIKRGVITAAEAAHAVSVLEAQIADSRSKQPANDAERDLNSGGNDERDQEEARPQPVSFSTRAYPLLEMLRAAQRAGNDVMWGV